MNLFFNGQDAINLKSVSQINLDTSFQCPALKSDSASWSEKITGTCLTISFKLEYSIIHYCLKNKRNQGSSLHLAESKISSVTIVNNQLTTLKWRLTPSPPCHWAVGAAGSGNNGGLQYSASQPPRGRQESALQELRAELSITIRDIKSVTGTEQTASHCTYEKKRYHEKSIYSHCYTSDKLFPPPCTMDI